MTTLIGTSGWMYGDWRGRFYPDDLGRPQWLTYYAHEFPVVEVNATFYRLASPAAVRRWRDAVPASFSFVVKGSRFLTHTLKLRGAEAGLQRFFAPLEALGDRCCAVLWQLPPWLPADTALLADFLDAAAAAGPDHVQHAVEFRHDTWYHDDVAGVLDEHGAMLVNVSGGKAPAPPPPFATTVTGGRAYVRFHGLTGFSHRYRDDELAPWVEHLAAQPEALVFFNNDGGAAAIDDARRLRAHLAAPAAV